MLPAWQPQIENASTHEEIIAVRCSALLSMLLVRFHFPEPVRRWLLKEKDYSNYLYDCLYDAKQSRNRICS